MRDVGITACCMGLACMMTWLVCNNVRRRMMGNKDAWPAALMCSLEACALAFVYVGLANGAYSLFFAVVSLCVCGLLGFHAGGKPVPPPKEVIHLIDETNISNSKQQLSEFYRECLKYDCRDMKSEKNRNRANLIAEQLCLQCPDGIEKLYNEARQIYRSELAEEVRKGEQEKFNKCNRYAAYKGREKRIAMIQESVTKNRCSAERMEQAAQAFSGAMDNYRDNGHHAATWGGIANGLAGVGAGITVAMQTELENREIRANNARKRAELTEDYKQAMGVARKYRSMVYEGEQLIKKAQVALVSDEDASEVLKKLQQVRNAEVEVSVTGAVSVKALFKLKKEQFIYDNVPAVVDGTIIALILEDGHEIARVNLVCPLQGINASETVELRGISPANAEEDKEYTIAFAADNLWLMEK